MAFSSFYNFDKDCEDAANFFDNFFRPSGSVDTNIVSYAQNSFEYQDNVLRQFSNGLDVLQNLPRVQSNSELQLRVEL